jgi:lipopolysaccharide transport system permease protein
MLAVRDIKIRYRQTALGGAWAILQPLLAMLLFTAVFRNSNLHSSPVPYALFVLVALVPWTFFSNAVSQASNSLVGNQQLVSKIYFPRVFIPLASVMALFVDLAISFVIALVWSCTAGYVTWSALPRLLALAIATAIMFAAAVGIGFFLSAMNVKYRDIKYAVPFAVQMGLFVSPVIYDFNNVSGFYRTLLSFNPMTGVIELFRFALLGMPASLTIVFASGVIAALLFLGGLFYFRRMESYFADVI